MEENKNTEIQTTPKKVQMIGGVQRRMASQIMNLFESEKVEAMMNCNSSEFEDLTDLIFNCVDNDLGDMELLTIDSFNYEETLSSFECMDPKMDQRFIRNEVFAQKQDLLKQMPNINSISQNQKLALIRELLQQFATWQDQVSHVQQSIFSNFIFQRKIYYQTNTDLLPFCEAILYIVYLYYNECRNSSIFRDEDVCLPINLDPMFDLQPKQIFELLDQNIDIYEKLPKSGDQGLDKVNKDIQKGFKMIQAILVFVVYQFDYRNFEKIFNLQKISENNDLKSQEQTQEKNDKKKKQQEDKLIKLQKQKLQQKAKDQLQIIQKFSENLYFKIFEDKYEKTNEQLWAEQLSDQRIYNTLPLLCNRKIFQKLNFKQTQQFYSKIQKQVKDLYKLQKQISSKQLNTTQILLFLKSFMEEKPCGLLRLLYEQTFFTDYEQEETLEPSQTHKESKDFIFFGSLNFEIRNDELIKQEILDLYPICLKYWDKDQLFMDFIKKECIMFRECVRRYLLNKTRQRRAYKRFFLDCQILMEEANMTEEAMQTNYNIQMTFETAPCLSMAINMYVEGQIDFMLKGFEINLFTIGELPSYCTYFSFIYQVLALNRQNLIQILAGGREQAQKLVNFYSIMNSSDKFNQQRVEFSQQQKMVVDQYELLKAFCSIFDGMQILSQVMIEIGLITDPLQQYDGKEEYQLVRQNLYNQRFGYFAGCMFPRFKSFQEFEIDIQKSRKEVDIIERLERAKNQLNQGKQYLQNLIDTDVSMKCSYLMNLQQLKEFKTKLVENALVSTMIKMKLDEGVISQYRAQIDFQKSIEGMPVIVLTKIQ